MNVLVHLWCSSVVPQRGKTILYLNTAQCIFEAAPEGPRFPQCCNREFGASLSVTNKPSQVLRMDLAAIIKLSAPLIKQEIIPERLFSLYCLCLLCSLKLNYHFDSVAFAATPQTCCYYCRVTAIIFIDVQAKQFEFQI